MEQSNLRSLDNKQLIEILSAIAVVFSLIFVGFELRQSNAIATRDARSQPISQLVEFERLAIENPLHASLLVKLSVRDRELSAQEFEHARAFSQMVISFLASVNVASDSGFLPDRGFEAYAKYATSIFDRYPGLGPIVERGLKDWGIGPDYSEIYARVYEHIGNAR
jgi:hypothetical protein